MFTFETDQMKHQFGNERYFYGLFKVMMIMLGVAFHLKFKKSLHITCVGRDYNKKSAHFDGDKLVCAIDVRTKDLALREIQWLANQNAYLCPYIDVIIEDHRMTGEVPSGGDHAHIELNPGWWVKF